MGYIDDSNFTNYSKDDQESTEETTIQILTNKLNDVRMFGKRSAIKTTPKPFLRRGGLFLRANAYGPDAAAMEEAGVSLAEEEVTNASNLMKDMFDGSSFLDIWQKRAAGKSGIYANSEGRNHGAILRNAGAATGNETEVAVVRLEINKTSGIELSFPQGGLFELDETQSDNLQKALEALAGTYPPKSYAELLRIRIVRDSRQLAFRDGMVVTLDEELLNCRPLLMMEFENILRHIVFGAVSPRAPPAIEEIVVLLGAIDRFLALSPESQDDVILFLKNNPSFSQPRLAQILSDSRRSKEVFIPVLEFMEQAYPEFKDYLDVTSTRDIRKLVSDFHNLTVLVFFPEFIKEDVHSSAGYSIQELEATIGREEAEKLLAHYITMLNKELAPYVLPSRAGKPCQGIRGSMGMYLVLQALSDGKIKEAMDKVTSRFISAEGWKIKLNVFAITSPATSLQIEDLYNSIPQIGELPVTYPIPEGNTMPEGNTVCRAGWLSALNAVVETPFKDMYAFVREREDSCQEEVLAAAKEVLAGADATDVLLARYFSRQNRESPQTRGEAERRNNISKLSGIAEMKLDENSTPQEKLKVYLRSLHFAARQGYANTAIAPQDVFDLMAEEAISIEDILDILLAAYDVFDNDSRAIKYLKDMLRYRFSKLEDEKTPANFARLWKAFRMGGVEDKLVIEWLCVDYDARQVEALGQQEENVQASQVLRLAKFVAQAEAKERQNALNQLVKMVAPGDVINIVGQARVGKTTAAKTIARKLHCAYFDAGLVYRGFAWALIAAIREGRIQLTKDLEKLDPEKSEDKKDIDQISLAIKETRVDFRNGAIFVNGRVVTEKELHADEIEKASGVMRKIADVRKLMLERERQLITLLTRSGRLVISGRGYLMVLSTNYPRKK